MTQLDPTKTVREVAVEIPGATRVFEKLNIDYCCGGNQTLREACRSAGVNVDAVSRWLDAAEDALPAEQIQDPGMRSLAELAAHIVSKHHTYTREALQRIALLMSKVCSAHGANHPELLEIQTEFQTLWAELGPHMMKEESILFPYIARLESSIKMTSTPPFAPFGTVRNPIAVMMKEHDAAGDILKTIRKLTRDFAVPADACASYRTMYEALQELEADLHLHIHLENNLLFPKAVEFEAVFS